MALIATATEYTGIDLRTGKPCHRASHTKEAKGYIRAARRADAIGLHAAAGVVSLRDGVGTCALCGGAGTLALAAGGRSGAMTLELCHDVPQCDGGAVCWCSMVLGHATCNRAMSDALTFADVALHCDARAYAAAGGTWAPWAGTRAAFSYTSTRALKCSARAAAWVATSPRGSDAVASLALRMWG